MPPGIRPTSAVPAERALAHSLIAGAHSDVNVAHVVAQFGKLLGEQLLQGLGGGDYLVGLTGRDKSDAQGLDGNVSGGGFRLGPGSIGGLLSGLRLAALAAAATAV